MQHYVFNRSYQLQVVLNMLATSKRWKTWRFIYWSWRLHLVIVILCGYCCAPISDINASFGIQRTWCNETLWLIFKSASSLAIHTTIVASWQYRHWLYYICTKFWEFLLFKNLIFVKWDSSKIFHMLKWNVVNTSNLQQ